MDLEGSNIHQFIAAVKFLNCNVSRNLIILIGHYWGKFLTLLRLGYRSISSSASNEGRSSSVGRACDSW